MNNHPSDEPYDLPITVSQGDIDQLGHVNNIVYLRWVQEAAIAHWNAAATVAQKEAVAWVVARHEIDYKYSARLGDEIIARTWVGIIVKNFFERHTEILRAKDRKLLARACTLWCPVDHRTGRPVRAGNDIREQWSVSDEKEESKQ